MLRAMLVQFLEQATTLRDQLEDLPSVAIVPGRAELARPLGRAEDDAGSLVDHLTNTLLALDAIEAPDPPEIEDLFKSTQRAKGMPF